jgi:hypothetical protein
MPKKINTEVFIEKAVAKHGNKYDYSESVYTKAKEILVIRCPTHGTFEQTPDCHLSGSGCTQCSYDVLSIERTKSLNKWIEEANLIHQFKYDYTNSIYTGSNEKINIRCPIHGLFEQVAFNHLKGHGCNECGNNKIGMALASDTDTFREKANTLHNYKYDYTKAIYTTARNKIEIICSLHVSFYQTPDAHLKGKGCSKCNLLGGIGFTKEAFVEQANKNYNGKAKLYFIRAYDDQESFLKVGITMLSISKRLTKNGNTKILPYSYEVLDVLEADAANIYDLEKSIHKQFKDQRQIPSKLFKGMFECFKFSQENMNDINTHFRKF